MMNLENWSDASLSERDLRWLVRLCAFLSGSLEAAEDLAQETLLEAWRCEASLREPEKRSAWLAGIARNVCKRWRRAEARNRTDPYGSGVEQMADRNESGVQPDLAVELERHELIMLLDRAMALLDPEVRDILVSRFVHESSHAEIARRFGLSEGTVKVRVHRGKLTLRRILETRFAGELQAFGYEDGRDGWQETRVWCSGCATHRLQMRIRTDPSVVMFRCPGCHRSAGETSTEFSLQNPQLVTQVGGLTRPATILHKGTDWLRRYYLDASGGDEVPCTRCGSPVRIEPYRRQGPLVASGGSDGIYVWCGQCGEVLSSSREGMVASHPAVRAFARQHQRIRIRRGTRIEAAGLAAVVIEVESITSADRVEVVTDAETCRIIELHRGSAIAAGI